VTASPLPQPDRVGDRRARDTRNASDKRQTRDETATLLVRVAGLRTVLQSGEPYLPPDRLSWGRTVVSHAEERLALSRDHTVVALAGATGGGKSSLFNALSGRTLSPVGVRRPTTSQTYACVWGSQDGMVDLQRWLRIPPEHWFTRPQVDDSTALDGLVLLDLPDFDSVERQHAVEVTRMLGLVDLVVWVVDPQKYADQVIHERHLPRFRRHRDVTVVALNQADLLDAADLDRLLADLRRLLNADGLDGVCTIATSAVDAPAGLAQLRAQLEEVVTGRRAAVQRLAADVDLAVEDLSDLVGPPAQADAVGPATLRDVTDGLAEVAGAAAVTEAMVTSYRHRAGAAMTWPLVRSLRRRGPDPWRRPGGPRILSGATAVAGPDGRGLAGPNGPTVTAEAPRAAISLVARAVAERAAAGLPEPWADAVSAAARSRLAGLAEALNETVTDAAARGGRHPRWWRLVGLAQWLTAAAALVGLGWLTVNGLLMAAGVTTQPPALGPVAVPLLLLGGGVGLAVVLTVAVRPLAGWAARRASAQEARRLRETIGRLGDQRIVEPVREVLDAYGEARAALATAAGT
jgi:hypothetical protein